jgi:hypothetical protein
MRDVIVTLGCISVLLAAAPAHCQQFTVQEPSFENFGVGTTVSVPDRGRSSVGGVRRSASARAMYGPVRTGHSLGLSDRGTGLSIQARVHDQAEMDRAALDAADNARKARNDVRLSDTAEHAYETLRTRRAVRDGAIAVRDPAGTEKASEPVAGMNGPEEGPGAERLLERARQAEASGKRQLALTYLKAARDRGSVPAQKEIERLSPDRR